MAKETFKIKSIISEEMLKKLNLKDNTTEDSNENEENITPENEEREENTNSTENPNKLQTIRKALKIVGKLVLTGLITAGTAISIATGLSALAAGGLTAIAFAINSTTNIAQIGEKLIDIIKESLSKKQLANIELEPAL
jgi:hypothetical protein